ncbi:endophilin-B1 isoform X2 [Hydra vulgaris]|uniref:endophilin-B1 isoform X2 n=1 Tax=Hydra vulgaris TaxID=6087 RepID=UPI001F5F0EF9|nr:endophilin-B1-like isoform X2 [Hydra vulgaris]
MASNAPDYKESILKIASSAISASKIGWSRARQFTEEQVGSAEKTQYDAQFENQVMQAEKTRHLTEKLLKQAEAMIQPNPGYRIEEFLFEKLDKKTPARPTNSFVLGETMLDASQEIGPGTSYGFALGKVGTGLKKIGNAEKDFMQKTVAHYLHPLKNFLDIEMKTISKEKRALDIKRLDLDACKNKVRKAVSPEKMREAENELRVVQAEFDRQQELTKLLLDSITTVHANHLSSLHSFVEAIGAYHIQCQQYVSEIQKELQLYVYLNYSVYYLTFLRLSFYILVLWFMLAFFSPLERPTRPFLPSDPPPYNSVMPSSRPLVTRRAKVLYDYDAYDTTELSLLADEIVTVYSVDGLASDWIIAERGSQSGKVPITYLELM